MPWSILWNKIFMLTPAETMACQRLVELALEEDLGAEGDLTSLAVIPVGLLGKAQFVARKAGVVAGLPVVEVVMTAVDGRRKSTNGIRSFQFRGEVEDGFRLGEAGTVLAQVAGPMQSILAAERIALNFLQRLSGIATLTGAFVEAVAGLSCQIFDTRKTTPGWRLLEKYAVRCGGGHNHRLGLHDGVLIKDNHLAALGDCLATIRKAVENVRLRIPSSFPLEIEVDNLEQLYMALTCDPDSVLLDNMNLAQLRDAVELRNQVAPKVLLEASGGVTLETVRAIAQTGVDRISVGALTHSAPALDIALDYRQ
jgi:nicotinate-nucleotide pyrophosphorylase (carboxylating)